MTSDRKYLLEKLQAKPSKKITENIIKYVGSDKKRFRELFELFEEAKGGISNRAAWAMSYLVIERPELIHPNFSKTISLLKTPGFHPAIYRNILGFLKEIKIPEKYQGEVYDACLHFFINASNPVAVRAFSLHVIRKIAKHHPELKNELKIILEEQKEFDDSPAVKNVINKILPSLNKD